MAGSTRRLALAVILLPLLLLAIPGLSRANTIFVNTTDGDSALAPLCSLPDAITAHNIGGSVVGSGCGPGSASDTIFIGVTGTILIDEPLIITGGTLFIDGPQFGCSGAGPCGVTIDGGGTVQLFFVDPGASLGLFYLTLADGISDNGGAILDNGANLTIDNCLLRNNTGASGSGGAIYANSTGAVTIVNSTITGNTATFGAGMWAFPNVVKITNSTISGNNGTGYFNAPAPSLKGTILSNNTGGNCVSTAPIDLNYNISDDGSCSFSAASSINNSSTAALNLDPLGLQNNGGPTETIALESPSNAIGLIPVANCKDQSGFPLETDQRLFARPDVGDPSSCDSGAFEASSLEPIVITPGSERLQIARSTSPNTDKVNMAFSFTYNGDGTCDTGIGGDEDALNSGFSLSLYEGTCASVPGNGLNLSLSPFVVHTVNHQQYGTLFQSSPPETVSARMVALKTPVGACGAWTLNLEVAGLDTATLGLGGGNPFALVLTDSPLGLVTADASVCFDITNAIVGNQIVTPGHGVRRGVRRQGRR